MVFADKTITYEYAADGRKLKMSASSGEVREYVGVFQYLNGSLLEITNEEGRYTPQGGYEYFHRDHLGNVRVVFKDGGNGTAQITQYTDYDPWGLALWGGASGGASSNRLGYNGKEALAEAGTNLLDYGTRLYDAGIGRWGVVDPMAEKREWLTPYNFCQNNPVNRIDPDGAFDFVLNEQGNIYWDKNANSQATTKAGETYLGKNLTFTFNSYINNSFDGPQPPWNVTGDKLTSTINVTGNEDKGGNLTSIDVKSSYSIGETGGLSVFEGRDYFPGLGADQNKAIDAKGMTGGSATFEQHASVPGLEAFGLNMLGYDVVNVAQKMTVGLSGNNLLVTAGTDVFPSATLSVNGNQLFQYNQPSFTGTHGRDTRTVIGDNGTGGSTTTETTSRRPAPSFHQRYPK